jgi:hypothetical protein
VRVCARVPVSVISIYKNTHVSLRLVGKLKNLLPFNQLNNYLAEFLVANVVKAYGCNLYL